MSDSKWLSLISSHAIFKLNLLACALCAAKISQDQHSLLWIQELPWNTFGNDLHSMITLQPIDAGAAWALWLAVNAALSAILLAKTLVKSEQEKIQQSNEKSKPILLRRWDDKLIESHKLDHRLNTYNPDLKLSTSKLRKILIDIDLGKIN